jgi:hypothetical protein
MEDWLSESQLAFKGEEITDHLGIPPCNEWNRYSTNHNLQFRKIYNGFLGQRKAQVGSYAWPPTPKNIERFALARTRRLSMSSLASASPISVPSASPLLSASQSSQSPSGQSSPTNASQDSAVEISDAVSKIFRKDKGFKGRFDKWKSQSLTTSFNRQDTDLVITQRLCVFFHVEITGYLWSQASRVAAYELQDENLAIQHQYLVSDYAAIFSGHQYPRYIGDVSTCQQLVQDAERQSLEQRRGHLRRILASLKAENIAGNALLERLQPYLPGFDESVLADVHNSSLFPMQSRTSGFQNALLIPPDTVQLQRRSTATRPGLRRSDLAISPPGLHQQAAPNFEYYQHAATCGGGGGSLSWDDQRVLVADAPSSRSYSPSHSSRSVSPDIPPPPSLTIPSSSPASTSPSSRSTSPDPTHLEVYSTSLNHTSTFSGTFSITLTLDPLSSGHAKADVIEGSEDSPDSDVAGDDPHARTAYPLGLTDIPAAGSSPDSDTVSVHSRASSNASSAPRSASPSVSSSPSDAGDARARDIEDYLIWGDNLEAQSDSSNASSAPLDHQADYIDWLSAGCPDSDIYD